MITLKNITKIYEGSDYKTVALDEVNMTIEKGDFIAIMGPSGSGKTTFLNIVGCMDTPSSGQYLLDNEDVTGYSSAKLTDIRKNYIGFVFQNFALLPDYTIYENIEVPLLAKNIGRKERKKRMDEKMELLGISGLGNKLPSQLSGGQQQRAAIARVLVADNPIILADEPTGALDQQTSQELMKIFCDLNQGGKTVILITHNPEVAKYAKEIIYIVDGKLSVSGCQSELGVIE
jgi:putative ABC transport system ATP-binding protein